MDQPLSGPATTPHRLYRSTQNRWVAGVCGGLAEYFNIDVSLVRIVFFIFSWGAGFGVGVYLLMWLFIPEAGKTEEPLEARVHAAGQEIKSQAERVAQEFRARDTGRNPALIPGLILVAIGVIALTNIYLPWHIFRAEAFWPIVLVVVGLAILFRRR